MVEQQQRSIHRWYNVKQILMPILALALAIAVLDQCTKYLIVEYLPSPGISIIPGFFNLVLAYNKGAAFGILGDLPSGVRQIALACTTLAALAAVLYLIMRHYADSIGGRIALALILGGAFGNILDRIRLGYVVDFLDFFIGAYHWPAFNVADSAICVGVAILAFIRPPVPAAEQQPAQ